jgi:hypothetical protein
MNNILLWAKDGLLRASQIEALPKAFTFEGRRFEPLKFYFADVDYLRDEKKQLIGFSFVAGDSKHELALCKLLVQQSKNIKLKDGFVLLFLKEIESFEFDVVQGIGTEIYHDEAGRFIFVIRDLGFGKLAFDFALDDIPIASAL